MVLNERLAVTVENRKHIKIRDSNIYRNRKTCFQLQTM